MPLSGDERQHIRQLIDQAGGSANPSGWFEPLYRQAQGNSDDVPWANLTANSYLLDWLNTSDSTAQIVGKGLSALVIGCGLGDDAEALAQAGYTVTAFDISETAIAWCQQRFPHSSVTYQVGDMFAPDPNWHRQFNLVFECRNFQALPIEARGSAMEAIASCVAPQGQFLIITNYQTHGNTPEGPPWALSEAELSRLKQQGFVETDRKVYAASNRTSPKIRLILQFNGVLL